MFTTTAVQKSVTRFEGGRVCVRKSHSMDSLLLSKIKKQNNLALLNGYVMALKESHPVGVLFAGKVFVEFV
jgi:hypothetical protein